MPKRTCHTRPATVLLLGPNDDRAHGRGNSDALRLEPIHLNWRSRTSGVNMTVGIGMVTSSTSRLPVHFRRDSLPFVTQKSREAAIDA